MIIKMLVDLPSTNCPQLQLHMLLRTHSTNLSLYVLMDKCLLKSDINCLNSRPTTHVQLCNSLTNVTAAFCCVSFFLLLQLSKALNAVNKSGCPRTSLLIYFLFVLYLFFSLLVPFTLIRLIPIYMAVLKE